MDRFACRNCNTEYLVKRTEGTVSISPIVDALKKVGVGVDKTAAELAIVRLQNEIAVLYDERRKILSAYSPMRSVPILDVICGLFGLTFIVRGAITIIGNGGGIGGIFVGCFLGVIFLGIAIVTFVLQSKYNKNGTKN